MNGPQSNKKKVIDIIKKSEESRESFLHQDQPKERRLFKAEQKERPRILEIPEEKEIIQEPVSILHKESKIVHHKEDRDRPKKKKSFKFYFWLILIFVLLGGFGYLAINILPKAEIKITAKKADWDYSNPVRINSKIADIDVVNRQIPAVIFSQKKNSTFNWPATGKKYIERKASGKITIYNEYSSDPQKLVANTRFEAPDGKIFHLKASTTVPGATIESGKIVASSIDGEVIADKPGEAYNISPVSRFTIPGFKDKPKKYEKFYGSSQNPMTGGFVGEAAYPTDNDIKKAKENSENQIKDIINSFLYSQIAMESFKVIEETKQFNILKEVINKNTDESGNFSIFIEAESSAQVFKEEQLLKLMSELARQVIGPDFQIKKYELAYDKIGTDQKTKLAVLPVNFKGNFWKPVDADDFKNKILGKTNEDLKTFIFSSSAIEKADISFWPFWVSNIPKDPKRVKIEVE